MLKIHIPLFPSKYRQSANGGGRSPNKVSWRKNGSGGFAARRPSGGNSAMSHFCNDHFPSPGKQPQYFSRHETVFPTFQTLYFCTKLFASFAAADSQLPLLIELRLRRIEKGNHSFDVVRQLFPVGIIFFHSGNISHISTAGTLDITRLPAAVMMSLYFSDAFYFLPLPFNLRTLRVQMMQKKCEKKI